MNNRIVILKKMINNNLKKKKSSIDFKMALVTGETIIPMPVRNYSFNPIRLKNTNKIKLFITE